MSSLPEFQNLNEFAGIQAAPNIGPKEETKERHGLTFPTGANEQKPPSGPTFVVKTSASEEQAAPENPWNTWTS